MERLWVWVPAGAAGEFSSPGWTFCADSHFGICSTPLLPQWHIILCWFSFGYLFHPLVTTVAYKRSKPFCQKCKWQVTAKHTWTLRMWLWSGTVNWCIIVWCAENVHWDGSSFTKHQPCNNQTALWVHHFDGYSKIHHKKRQSPADNHTWQEPRESEQEQWIVLVTIKAMENTAISSCTESTFWNHGNAWPVRCSDTGQNVAQLVNSGVKSQVQYWHMFDSLCVARIFVLESAFSADSFMLFVHPPCACSHMYQHLSAWKNPEHWQPYTTVWSHKDTVTHW